VAYNLAIVSMVQTVILRSFLLCVISYKNHLIFNYSLSMANYKVRYHSVHTLFYSVHALCSVHGTSLALCIVKNRPFCN